MKILVVDDEEDIKFLFLQKFRKEIKNGEYEFLFSLSGEEALRVLREKHPTVVMILSDINMPGMSGLSLLEKVKSQFENPSPKVMMITAYGDENNYKSAMQLGADDFLTKPVDFEQLKSKLKVMM